MLFGVTGSGKTEVYMELIDRVLNMGKSAIMLVPEISLTPQIVDRFVTRFGDNVAILHSGLSDTERYDEYRKITTGKSKIVIPLSIIFLNSTVYSASAMFETGFDVDGERGLWMGCYF